jgi:type II secretory pathway component PulF
MRRQVKLESLIIFTRQLMTLLRAGIPLFRALNLVLKETTDPKMKKVIEKLLGSLSEGQSFSEAIIHSLSFSVFYENMVKVGENRGSLDESLELIFNYLQKQREVQQKLTTALSYPLLLFLGAVGVMGGLFFYVIPRFKSFFVENQIVMPPLTKFLFGLSGLLTDYPLLAVLLLALGPAAILWSLFHPQGKKIIDQTIFKWPVLGPMILAVACAQFARSLGTLYLSGVPLIQSLQLSQSILHNQFLNNELEQVINAVRNGKSLSEPFSESKFFPGLLTQMLAIGEESGQLGQMAIRTAEFFEEESEYRIKRQLALIEPLALAAVAILVAMVAASVMLPLFKMATNLRIR